jgi:MFS family permease
MTVDEEPSIPPEIPPPLQTPGMLGRARGFLVDLTPLRESREFRLLWTGQAISEIGSHISMIAIPFQLYKITGSTLAVGLLGFTELVPLLVFSLLGGAIADAMDRRKLLIRAQAGLAVVSGVLAFNALPGQRHLWILYAMSFAQAAGYAIYLPGMRSLVPRLVPAELLPSANALEAAYGTTAHLLGPTLGGVLIAAIGLTNVYLIDIATFAAALYTAWLMRPSPPVHDENAMGWTAIREGLRFLKGRKVLQSTFTVDLNAMIFGMPQALFPAFAFHQLHGGPRLLGLLYAAPFAGAFFVTMLSGRARHVRRQGLVTMICVVLWGAFIAGFGLAHTVWLALLMLGLAGAADMISAIYRSTILQTVSPDELRGRLMGIELAVVASGPSLGNVEAGVVASLVNLPFAIVSGGIACIVGVGVLAARVPQFARYDAKNPTP